MRTWDVVVLGLGTTGSAAAMHLARRGRRVLGLERFAPAHDRGSSHGRSRIIRLAYFEHPDYVPLLRRSYEGWRALERDVGQRLLVETGGLMIGRPDSEVVAGSIASARRHGLPHRVLDAGDLRREWPALRPRPDEVALHETIAGVLLAEECVRAQQAEAVRAGAELRFGAEARLASAPDAPGPVVLEVNGARVEAERLVVTAGAWVSRALAAGEAPPVAVERNWFAWFPPATDAALFEPARFPIWVWDRGAGRTAYGFPALGGDPPKAAFHHGGGPADPDVPRAEPAPAEVAELRAWLRGAIPALDAPPSRVATCMYTNTTDQHFALGLRRGGRVVIGSACSGHGFKLAPAMGEALADLALDGASRLPIGFLLR